MHKIYTASVKLTSNTYENCQTITQVDLMQTPWVSNSMYNAFQNCHNLHTVTNIDSNVVNLYCAFNNCTRLVNAPTIPANVTNMYQAFSSCSNLINIPTFPPNLNNLAGAFSWCSSIVTVPTIPNSVRNLNDGFYGCIALTTVPSLINLNCVELSQTFLNCKSLTTQPILPEKATYLYRTFLGCSNLTTINIQQNVYYLYETYYGCSNLTTIPNISKNVNKMYHTFGACVNITGDINILSDKIVNVTNLFGETSLRKNVYIPPVCYNDTSINSPTYNSFIAAGYDNIGTKDGVYLMYNYAPALPSDWITSTAANNTIILKQYIGANTTVITPHNDWYSNKVLNTIQTAGATTGPFIKNNNITVVDLSNVEVIDNNLAFAFHACDNLATVTNINPNVTNLKWTFYGCGNLTNFVPIPPNAINLEGTFESCTNASGSPVIPNSVVNLASTFDGCKNLTQIPEIPDSVTNTYYTFGWCSGLTTVDFISNNTLDCGFTFAACSELLSANVSAPNAINCQDMFDLCQKLTDLNVSIPNSTNITNIFKDCTNLTNVYAEFNAAQNTINLFNSWSSLKTTDIYAQNATNAYRMFFNCYSLENANVTVSNTTNIDYIFYNCSNLTDLNLVTGNITNLGDTFYDCSALTNLSFTIPDSVTTMVDTFWNCRSLQTFPTIPNSVTKLSCTFGYCLGLTTATAPTIPNSVTNMYQAYASCWNLTDALPLPPSVINIAGIFASCAGMTNTSITIPNSVVDMARSFSYCIKITSAPNIPDQVTNMYQTFNYCTNLTGNIYVKSNQITNATDCFLGTSLTKNVFIPFEYENGVNTATRNSFEAAYPINTISGTTVGTLTDDNGVISGFSDSAHIEFPETLDVGNNNWEIVFKIKTPTIGTAQDIGGHSSNAGQLGMSLYLSADGYASYNIGDTNWLIQPKFGTGLSSNTWYWLKAKYENGTYYAYISTDGINYTLTQSIINSYKLQPLNLWLGDYVTGYTHWFEGQIDLKECYIKVNGEKWWNGYVRPNGVVLKDIDGSRIAIIPNPADATVLMYNETTGTEVDEEVLNKFSYTSINGNVEIQALNTTDTAIVVPSQWVETNRMRAPEGSIIHYRVYKDGYYPVESQVIVDRSQDINVNLEQIMCTYSVVPFPSDATVTLTAPGGIIYYAWTGDIHANCYTTSATPAIGDTIYNLLFTPVSTVASFDGTMIVPSSYISKFDSFYRYPADDEVRGPTQEGNSITVPWGTEVSYTVSKAHYTTVTGTEIVKTTGSKGVPLVIDKHTFTINPTPVDAAVQILVNGRLVNASNSDWVFTANNANGDIELQEYVGSNTVVVMPTSYETTNTVTADYGSTIEWKVSKQGYHPQTSTLTLEQDTTLSIELVEITYGVNVDDYNYTLDARVLTLTQYTGNGGSIDTPEIEEL